MHFDIYELSFSNLILKKYSQNDTPNTHTQFQRCPLLMQILLACGQWGLDNDSITEWMPIYEEHFAMFRDGRQIPWKLDGSSLSLASVT
jgi:hypothetical protein